MKDGKQRLSVVPSGRGTYAKQACSHCRKRHANIPPRPHLPPPHPTSPERANATEEHPSAALARRRDVPRRYAHSLYTCSHHVELCCRQRDPSPLIQSTTCHLVLDMLPRISHPPVPHPCGIPSEILCLGHPSPVNLPIATHSAVHMGQGNCQEGPHSATL